MQQEEIAQLLNGCNAKRESLRNYREQINGYQKQLLKAASQRLDKDDLTDLEHYQNQFHIQLINIHDLKHELRAYDSRIANEERSHAGVSEEAINEHKRLHEEYESLEKTLGSLHHDFEEFLRKMN